MYKELIHTLNPKLPVAPTPCALSEQIEEGVHFNTSGFAKNILLVLFAKISGDHRSLYPKWRL